MGWWLVRTRASIASLLLSNSNRPVELLSAEKNVQMKHFDTKLKYYTHTKSCSKFLKKNEKKKRIKKKSIKNK